MRDPENPNQVESYVAEKLELLKSNYRLTADADIPLIAAEAIYRDLEGLPTAKGSVQLARLLTFICDLRLSRASSIADLQVIKERAEKSVEILLSSRERGSRITQAISSASLYLAVALKAQSKKDEAFDVIDRVKSDIQKFFDPSFIDEISLSRQETLMRGEKKEFAKLLEAVPLYVDAKPVEAYASIKRVFEFSLNEGYLSQAEDLLPVLNETFRQSSPELGALAKVSYQKNIGQYYLAKGELASARRVLEAAHGQATKFQFSGQLAQINSLLAEVYDGGDGRLREFRFD